MLRLKSLWTAGPRALARHALLLTLTLALALTLTLTLALALALALALILILLVTRSRDGRAWPPTSVTARHSNPAPVTQDVCSSRVCAALCQGGRAPYTR